MYFEELKLVKVDEKYIGVFSDYNRISNALIYCKCITESQINDVKLKEKLNKNLTDVKIIGKNGMIIKIMNFKKNCII